jgi:hypothetical protein
MKSDEAFMLEFRPAQEGTLEEICVAFHRFTGRLCDKTATQAITELLRGAASDAIKTLKAARGMPDRENQETRLRRVRVLHRAKPVTDGIVKALFERGAASQTVTGRLQSVIQDEIDGYLGGILSRWALERQEEEGNDADTNL